LEIKEFAAKEKQEYFMSKYNKENYERKIKE
jgi:hypothetical protein